MRRLANELGAIAEETLSFITEVSRLLELVTLGRRVEVGKRSRRRWQLSTCAVRALLARAQPAPRARLRLELAVVAHPFDELPLVEAFDAKGRLYLVDGRPPLPSCAASAGADRSLSPRPQAPGQRRVAAALPARSAQPRRSARRAARRCRARTARSSPDGGGVLEQQSRRLRQLRQHSRFEQVVQLRETGSLLRGEQAHCPISD